MSSDLANQINSLIFQLRQPSSKFDEHKKKISAVAYYLPLIKNQQNLWLILQELALSPGLFDESHKLESIPLILYAVDGFSYACERKHRISAPTLTPAKWEAELMKIVFNIPPVLGLIIISGIVNANVANSVPVLLRFVQTVGDNSDLIPVVAAALSRAQWSFRFTADVYLELPHSHKILDFVLTKLLYTQQSLDLRTAAVTTDLGGWSRLVSGLLLNEPPAYLLSFLETQQLFVRTLAARYYNQPEALKQFYFGLLIQIEGIANQILANARIHRDTRTQLSIAVLCVLQPLGFVIEHLGSQFESYQFVLNSCLDTLSSGKTAVPALAALGEHWAFGRRVDSPTAAGDIVFFFEVSEQLMAVITPVEAEQFVISIVTRFLDTCEYVSVFESAHSVMLAFLATNSHLRFSKSQLALRYFGSVVDLFPTRLGPSQFRTAVGAILRALSYDESKIVLEQLFMAAKASIPGYPLPPRAPDATTGALPSSTASSSQKLTESSLTKPTETELSNEAPTLRAALVSTLLHSVGDKCSALDLQNWLSLISPMIPQPFSVLAQQEREYLIKDIGDVVTSLGSETSDVGIRWYFKEDWNSKL